MTFRHLLTMLACVGLALALPPGAATHERAAPSMAELIEKSDVIVAGVMPEATHVIEVSSYLRGQGPRRLAVDIYASSGSWPDKAFRLDEPGVFFLRRDGTELVPTGWQAFSNDRSYVESLIHVARDPGPFLSSPRWRSNPDVMELLATRFDSFRVTAAVEPDLADWLEANRIDPFPWSMKGRRDITLNPEPEAPYRLSGDGTAAGDRLAAIINHNSAEWNGLARRASAPARFTVTFDTRRPSRWGSIGPGAALEILNEALRSRSPWTVTPAIWALGRLRADEAVPRIIALLDHEDRDVVRVATIFLRRSRDPRAVRALIEYLDRGADHSRMENAAEALRCIGGETALPVFRIRASHVQNARVGLGEFGTIADIKALVEDTGGTMQLGHGALFAARERTNAAADTWHNPGLIDKQREQRLWSEWWSRNHATLRIVTPPTAPLRLRCYE
jgi:hypothetical protein